MDDETWFRIFAVIAALIVGSLAVWAMLYYWECIAFFVLTS